MNVALLSAFWTAVVVPSFWSLALVGGGLAGQWLVGERKRIGWVVCIGTQALWIAYALVNRQYGFLLSAGLFGLMYSRNWRRWGREARA